MKSQLDTMTAVAIALLADQHGIDYKNIALFAFPDGKNSITLHFSDSIKHVAGQLGRIIIRYPTFSITVDSKLARNFKPHTMYHITDIDKSHDLSKEDTDASTES